MEYQKNPKIITKVSKNLQQNNSRPVTNDNDTETSKERCVSPEERHKIIDNLRPSTIV